MTCTKQNSAHEYCQYCYEACPVDIKEYNNNCIICERERSVHVLNEIQALRNAKWTEGNALRLTQSFKDINWNKTYHYSVDQVVYFTGNRRTDANGGQSLYVCSWETNHNNASAIPESLWISADLLTRALDVPDRQVRNYNINYNVKARDSLSTHYKL
jgi:hypothetical protein